MLIQGTWDLTWSLEEGPIKTTQLFQQANFMGFQDSLG